MFNGKNILVTGGTGSFGKKFIEVITEKYTPNKVIVYSRDELKQYEMQPKFNKPCMRYFIGDIRDAQRLSMAMKGVDYVVHAAALKHVPVCEYNPFEAVRTNIVGGQNVAMAAIENGVQKVITLSTDKAVAPVNLYGATKLAMEKVLVAANAYVGAKKTSFSLVRYGNVVGSRGSVIPFFKKLVSQGEKVLPLTDDRMTRFWITLEQSVQTVIRAFEESVGGEVFIPKIPSMKMVDLAKAFGDDISYKVVGIRPGEKLHETLISEDESRMVRDIGDLYVILPSFSFETDRLKKYENYPSVQENFFYRSDINDVWLNKQQLMEMI
ncbi:MAG: UDP-N-acetylglucosamine 4,6-dehydratase (inverting) [Candidatus Margulisbacteria bacterium GWF2_35_9]|nr:MAG: UDP-N-acetylglucosamine 4,6-dehydratase (inverting) [Candidatus Margulisbacteria bacterium GWF2_35_9]